MKRRPDLFIVGAPKSGTTSLYEYLDGHPEIFMSPVKEPFYFSPDVVGGPRRRFSYGEDEDEYLGLFAKARNEKRLGEASTRYLASQQAPSLIRAFQPEARIVVMLRNPVDVLYALHNERVSYGGEEILDFEEALAADEDRMAGRRLRPHSNPAWAVYRNWVQYGRNIANWLDSFPREQLHVIIFDDFAADAPGELRRLLDFLEVDPDYRPASYAPRRVSHRRRGGIVRTVVESRPAQRIAHHGLPAIFGRTTASNIIWRFRQSRINRRRYRRPPLPAAIRRRLAEEFRGEVARASELVGRDLVGLWFGSADEAAEGRAEEVVTTS